MIELLQAITAMESPFNMIVLIVLISCGAGAVNGIASQVRKYLTHRDEMDLKREMLASGMSADEIERVSSSRPTRS